MASTAVIQVKQGIGDVIWHLPFVRAIAAATAEGAVTFLTPPSSRANELLEAEPSVAEVVYFAHGGSELQRPLQLARLVALLRARDFRRIWILDRTLRPALAALLAGIPERIGPGAGAQRWLITNAGLHPSQLEKHAIDWLRALLAAMQVPIVSSEPDLKLPARLLETVRARYRAMPRPWLICALGAAHPQRDWPDESWSALLAAVAARRDAGAVFLIGGAAHAERAEALIARARLSAAVNACDLSIGQAAALLSLSDLFVGPDSGPMNLAAAVGTPSFGLFGVNPPLSYSRFLHRIEPDDGRGQGEDGMRRISPAAVLRRIEPYLGVARG